jgi:hypothetical protein
MKPPLQPDQAALNETAENAEKWLSFSFDQEAAKLEAPAGFSLKSAQTAPAGCMSYVCRSVFAFAPFSSWRSAHVSIHSLPLQLLFGVTGFLFVVAIYFLWVRKRGRKPVE